jgi:hypothetical protein
MATLYDFPVTLPSDLVYFARTAALIEGLGSRYDARFNAVTFAAPVALRMRHAILDSLRDPDNPHDLGIPVDWAQLLGVAAGQAAATVVRVGRELGRELGAILTPVLTPLLGRLAAEWATITAPPPPASAPPTLPVPAAEPAPRAAVLPAPTPRALGAGELAAD